jgi:hypothetical protein
MNKASKANMNTANSEILPALSGLPKITSTIKVRGKKMFEEICNSIGSSKLFVEHFGTAAIHFLENALRRQEIQFEGVQ